MLRLSCLMLLAIAIAVTAYDIPASAAAPSDKPISGAPTIIEGDLLIVGETHVRLYGIDAPEKDQVCMRNEKEYACGRIATTGLMDLTAGVQNVTCYPTGKTLDGSVIARCLDPQKFDLSQQMVYTGWALALPDAANMFHDLQAKAQKAKRGLWKGHVTPPWRWRPTQ